MSKPSSCEVHHRGDYAPALFAEKAGVLTLSHPANWILIMVQALVRAQCARILIWKRKNHLWVIGATPSLNSLRLSDLLDLEPATEARTESSDILLSAAAAALQYGPKRLVVAIRDDLNGPLESVVITGAKLDTLTSEAPVSTLSDLCAAFYIECEQNRMPSLRTHLPYCLQFCPIPVSLEDQDWWYKVSVDLRVLHWINNPSKSKAYDSKAQPRVSLPLLADYYDAEGTGLLLKPPGGDTLGHFSSWSDGPSPAGWEATRNPLVSISAFGRYVKNVAGKPTQSLEWKAYQYLANTPLASRGKGLQRITTCCGRIMVYVTQGTSQDAILPIRFGVTQPAILGSLRIPGLIVVASVEDVPSDRTGLALEHGENLERWLADIRERVQKALDRMVEDPPKPRVSYNFSWRANCIACSVIGGTACLVLGPPDLFMIPTWVFVLALFCWIGLRALRAFLPQALFEKENLSLRSKLQARATLSHRT